MTNADTIRQMIAKREEKTTPAKHASLAELASSSRYAIGSPSSREQLMQMCARVDLLALAQADTGETGSASGSTVSFRGECPICHRHDDFRVYTDTNTWACFGGSNPDRKGGKQAAGGNVLDYLKTARHNGDNVAAITELHELSGIPYEPKRKDGHSADQGAPDGQGDGFPPITRCRATEPPRRAPVLIEGILRKGHTLLVTARSKAGKTFLMLELAVSVACGGHWLGRACERGRVLFVNPEVDPPSAENRLHDVAEAMCANLETVGANVDFWHLRGHAQGIEETARALTARVDRGEYALIILDSVYELYTGDENSAEDARAFFHAIDRIAKRLDCSVAMTHHHAKGIRADLDALDRGSGSGVFGRKPDAPLDMIQVFPPSDDDTGIGEGVTVWRVSDSGLREFPGLEPFDVLFKYPRHILVAENATAGWKPKSGQQTGGKRTGEGKKAKAADRAKLCELALAGEFIAQGIGEGGIAAGEAADIVSERIGETVKTSTLKNYIDASEVFDVEQVSSQRWRIIPKRAPQEPPPSLELN